MTREEQRKRAEEMRENSPAIFQITEDPYFNEITSTEEFYVSWKHVSHIHFYLVKPTAVPSPLPFVINIHGGGMVREHGPRDLLFSKRFAARGCAVISLDYKLAPEFKFPYALQETEALADYLNANANEYGLLPGNYMLCGQSSGGSLAVAASMLLKESSFPPLGQVICYGLLDQNTPPCQKPDPCSAERILQYQFYHECYLDEADSRDPQISPVFASMDQLSKMPWSLFIEGGLDELKNENFKMFQLLCNAGNRAEMIYYPQSMHGFVINQMAEWQDAQEQIFSKVINMLMQKEDA